MNNVVVIVDENHASFEKFGHDSDEEYVDDFECELIIVELNWLMVIVIQVQQ